MSTDRDERLRVRSICRDPRTGAPNLVDMAVSTWWHHTRNTPGWPQPIRLTKGTTVWSRREIDEFFAKRGADSEKAA